MASSLTRKGRSPWRAHHQAEEIMKLSLKKKAGMTSKEGLSSPAKLLLQHGKVIHKAGVRQLLA
jgi:hypothetical protein